MLLNQLQNVHLRKELQGNDQCIKEKDIRKTENKKATKRLSKSNTLYIYLF